LEDAGFGKLDSELGFDSGDCNEALEGGSSDRGGDGCYQQKVDGVLPVEKDDAWQECPAGGEGDQERAEVEGSFFGEQDPEYLGSGDTGGGDSGEVGDGAEEERRPTVHESRGHLADEEGGSKRRQKAEEE